jgi:hypothetical protein
VAGEMPGDGLLVALFGDGLEDWDGPVAAPGVSNVGLPELRKPLGEFEEGCKIGPPGGIIPVPPGAPNAELFRGALEVAPLIPTVPPPGAPLAAWGFCGSTWLTELVTADARMISSSWLTFSRSMLIWLWKGGAELFHEQPAPRVAMISAADRKVLAFINVGEG